MGTDKIESSVSNSALIRRYAALSAEAKEVLSGMVEYCVENRLCMGMDCGENLDTGKDHPFVKELRKFAA